MKTLLNDLYIYELILLFLGVFLFLILSFALVYYVYKKENIKKLLLFFSIPIIMIGYPSIKELKISANKIEFSRYQEEYAKDPQNENLKKKLEELTAKLEKRLSAPKDLLLLSKVKVLLVKPDEAIKLAEQAVEKIKEEEHIKDIPKTISDKNKNTINPNIAKAIQIKDLANIQKNVIKEKDTVALDQKIYSLPLIDPELLKTRNAIKINTQKKIESTTFKMQTSHISENKSN